MLERRRQKIPKGQIDKICVDSGMVLICDPAYIQRTDVISNIRDIMTGRRRVSGIQPVKAGSKGICLGAIVKAFQGDGAYPVWTRVDDAGHVLSVTVELNGRAIRQIQNSRKRKEARKNDSR